MEFCPICGSQDIVFASSEGSYWYECNVCVFEAPAASEYTSEGVWSYYSTKNKAKELWSIAVKVFKGAEPSKMTIKEIAILLKKISENEILTDPK